MLSILAILSDIPLYIAELISKITGADISGFVDSFSDIFAKAIEFAEQLLK